MTPSGFLQCGLYLAVVLALAWPLGLYMARVYEGRPLGLDAVLGGLERAVYRAVGPRGRGEMTWKAYASAMLAFNLAGFALLYGLQRWQARLPLNPQGFGAISPDLAFNNAAGFLTTADWQSYAGETTMSYLTQMLALT
ncbi:MAG TPA: potassium-transporting ATPase subunit KdpA, partial [Candidatus Methylomirabilis sp.]|nr:potassium-transporting ATPase subunit KdpA [Candidatus Methylomirabilis sp.]